MTDLRTRTDFSAFQEVVPGTWIAGLQQSKVTFQGMERTETTRMDNLSANGEIPAALFAGAEAFFPGGVRGSVRKNLTIAPRMPIDMAHSPVRRYPTKEK